MKRILAVILSVSILLSLTACAGKEPITNTPDNHTEPIDNSNNTPETTTFYSEPTTEDAQTEYSVFTYELDLEGVSTFDELETCIEEHLDKAIESLYSQWNSLSAKVDSYKKYCDNSEMVSTFYETIVLSTEQMCIMLKEYTAVYARMILDSDLSAEKKYKAAEGIQDALYDDACDEIKDEIYDGLLNDMSEQFYDGILDKQPDDVSYSDWYEIASSEYSQWYETSSDVYSLYYNTASDIYSFYYDLSSRLYSHDIDRAEKLYSRFLQRIERDKGVGTGSTDPDASFDTALRPASSIEELETVVYDHVTECINALQNEWTTLSKGIDTYEEYAANIDAIEEFHQHIEEASSQVLIMICEYGIAYSELILQSDSSAKDKYKDFEGFKDCIYDDACQVVRDEIYEDLLKDIKDYYYAGIIKDARDDIPYSEWSKARSDAYSWWSDARSEVYEAYADTRSDLYDFYSDIRSELYDKDIDGAIDELDDFKKKVEKMK